VASTFKRESLSKLDAGLYAQVSGIAQEGCMEGVYITVEEAASRLGISIATVRRRCSQGKLAATKVGKAWVIDQKALPRPTARRTRRVASASTLVDFSLALRHLRTQDLARDLWVPDILNFRDDLADVSRIKAAAADRLDLVQPFDPPTSVPIPKSAIFLRNATNLTLADRLAYHASVLPISGRIEAQTGDGVFSARLATERNRFLKPGADSWVRWKNAVELNLGTDRWMAETDITSFFDCIHHTILMKDLESLGAEPVLRSAIREMLKTWSTTPNTGIPQGPDASRILANFYMHPIDDVMNSLVGVAYYRYMDDIRIVSPDKHSAIAALRLLDEECRRRNLYLSTKKTQLLDNDHARAALTDDLIDSVNYVFEHGDDPKEKRGELKKLFRKAVSTEVNTRRAKFSIYRLRNLRDKGVLGLVMKRLDDLAPLGWLLPAYILPWLRNTKTAADLGRFFDDPERNTSDYLSTWLLAAVLDEPHAATDDVVRYAKGVAFDPDARTYHRAVAMSVVALAQNRRDLDRLRDTASTGYDPEIVRGALVALFRAGALDKSVADRASRIDGIDSTLSYLKGRKTLPSLIFSSIQNPLAS